MQNSDLSIFKEAIKTIESKVNRDFYELESLRTNYNSAKQFAFRTIEDVEKSLIWFFQEKMPEFSLSINDKKVTVEDSPFTIIINPLRGIKNFIHAIPYFATTIALSEKLESGEEKIVLAVVNNYITQELFFTEENKGAFVNSRRVRVSDLNNLKESIISVKQDKDRFKVNELFKKLYSININNCSILDILYVAQGKYDAGFIFEVNPTDSKVGKLFIKEAGGLVKEFGEEKENLLFSNSSLIAELKNLI